jgi:hypothetical protein
MATGIGVFERAVGNGKGGQTGLVDTNGVSS